MCGRFEFFAEGFPPALNQLLFSLAPFPRGKAMKTGSFEQRDSSPKRKRWEVAPGDKIFVWTKTGFQGMAWGWPNPVKKGLLINIRSETALQKPMFASRLAYGRGIVFAKGYYEWDSWKRRYFVEEPGVDYIAMAALWNRYEEEERFAILTAAAQGEAAKIHHRVPLLLNPEQIALWMGDETRALSCLNSVSMTLQPKIMEEQKPRQLTLFDL